MWKLLQQDGRLGRFATGVLSGRSPGQKRPISAAAFSSSSHQLGSNWVVRVPTFWGTRHYTSLEKNHYFNEQLRRKSHHPRLVHISSKVENHHSDEGGNSNDNDSKGKQLYQDALRAMEQVEELQKRRETQKSQEMHRAIERAEAKQDAHKNNPKASSLKGVTVVKTIVKQTRKEWKQQQASEESSSISTSSEETKWEEKAKDLLEEAAFTYLHPQALILCGNNALKEANALYSNLESDTQQQQAHETMITEAKNHVRTALDCYQKAGEQGAAEGWFNQGQLLWTGYPLVLEPDQNTSMNAFRKAIDLGDADAMYFVAVQILSTEEEEEQQSTNHSTSLQEGLFLMESSAALGHGAALHYLALLHLNGHEALDIAPCDPETFTTKLNAAVDAGDADALFLRGHSYHQGDNGYPCDYQLALQDFLAGAENGHTDSAVSAGAILHQGRTSPNGDGGGSVPQNQRRAFELYQTAGELGSLEGWRNVAACYALGEGVPQSEATAKYILRTMLKDT